MHEYTIYNVLSLYTLSISIFTLLSVLSAPPLPLGKMEMLVRRSKTGRRTRSRPKTRLPTTRSTLKTNRLYPRQSFVQRRRRRRHGARGRGLTRQPRGPSRPMTGLSSRPPGCTPPPRCTRCLVLSVAASVGCRCIATGFVPQRRCIIR